MRTRTAPLNRTCAAPAASGSAARAQECASRTAASADAVCGTPAPPDWSRNSPRKARIICSASTPRRTAPPFHQRLHRPDGTVQLDHRGPRRIRLRRLQDRFPRLRTGPPHQSPQPPGQGRRESVVGHEGLHGGGIDGLGVPMQVAGRTATRTQRRPRAGSITWT